MSRVSCVAILSSVTTAAAVGQEPSFSADVNLVLIYANVQDPKGRIIRDLTKENFAIEEDGKPQAIRCFSREFNAPITIGLLIDTCQQPRTLPVEKAASYTLLDKVIGLADKAFVFDLGRGLYLAQDLTNSHDKLKAAISGLILNAYQGGGGCRILEGVQQASEKLKPEGGRKAIILLSHGMDRKSKTSSGTAIEFAERADAMVYSIPFEPELMRWTLWDGAIFVKRGQDVLQRLSRDTGGGYFPITKDQPIEKIFGQIEEELRSQYVIGFIPDSSKSSPDYRNLRITVNKRDLTVRARDGYYPK